MTKQRPMRALFVGLVLVVSAAVAAGGCAKRSEVADVSPRKSAFEAATYYPLAVGNKWTYDVNLLGEHSQQTFEIVGEEGGYFLDSAGGKLRRDAFGVRDEKRYLLKDPLEVGQSWTNVVSVSSVERYQVMDVGAPCRSAAGQFEGCVRVESRNRMDENSALVNQFTFAPHVGIVRIEVVAERGEEHIPQTSLELKSYQVR